MSFTFRQRALARLMGSIGIVFHTTPQSAGSVTVPRQANATSATNLSMTKTFSFFLFVMEARPRPEIPPKGKETLVFVDGKFPV